MKVLAQDIVWKFAPNARPEYEDAFIDGEPLLDDYDIVTSSRLAHFMAQVFHETGALRIIIESGMYTLKSLARMWDGGNWHKYFENRDKCLAMGAQCANDHGEALFNLVYGNRMGNGPASTGDGWRFRGRGLMQTTGRWAYQKYGQLWDVDFEAKPDLIFSAGHALKPALSEWKQHDLNKYADAGEITIITKRINGGLVGLAERTAWFNRIYPFIAAGVSPGWRVQGELYKRGTLSEKPDGIVGKHTRDAIAKYRQEVGLPSGEQIDDALLKFLGVA